MAFVRSDWNVASLNRCCKPSSIQRSPGRFLVSASPYDSLSQRYAEMASVDSLDIRPIPASATINVRHAVLWPDAPLERVLLSEDDGGVHFGAFLCGKDDPLAVISLFQENIPAANDASEYIEVNALTDASTTSTKIFRFRKFACYQSYQGQGIGSALLRHALLHARTGLGASVVWCDARTATQDWYRKRGLVSFTKPFYKHSVEYIRMKVVL